MNNKVKKENQQEDIVVYNSSDGDISFNVNVFEETVWLTQKQMAALFDKSVKTISEHIVNILKEEELDEKVVIRNFRTTMKHGAIEGKTQTTNTKTYNLDVVISVGYRVKSPRGIQFRQWATKILKQYMLNGYAVNKIKIKQIESSLNQLVTADKIRAKEISEIKNLLTQLITRPIIIHNHSQLSLANNSLETKIIELLDQLISTLNDNEKIKDKLAKIKNDIPKYTENPQAKKRLLTFLQEMGDSNSKTHKMIIASGITKTVITELINLCSKLKGLF